MASPKRVWTLAVAILFCCRAGAAAADGVDLTGIWRDDGAPNKDDNDPVKATLPNAAYGQHGTYESWPYIQILRNKQHELHLYTDVGAVRAVLQPVAGDPKGAYKIVDMAGGKLLGILHVAPEMCGSKPLCFQIAADNLPWPNTKTTIYIPMVTYDPKDDPKLEQAYSSNFSPTSSGQGYAAKSYDLRSLDPTNFQDNDPQKIGSGGRLFVDPPADSYSYRPLPNTGEQKVDIPMGWTLNLDDSANGLLWTKTIDTGRDMENADSLEVGVKAKLNLFGVTAKTSVSVATSQKIQQMTDTKSVVARSDYVATKYALVLNRRRTALTDDFINEVKDLKGKPAHDGLYDHFLSHWGTHYANAVTLGSRGSRTLTLDEQHINTLHENKVDVNAALSVGYDGNSAEAHVKAGHDGIDSIKRFVATENVKFTCYGGGSCSADGVPSGADLVPIYLDLRPLSDLLAPPFFSGDEEIFGQVRQNLAERIREAAFVDRKDLDDPTLSLAAVNVVNPTTGRPQLLCTDKVLNSRACCTLHAIEPTISNGGGRPAVAALTLKGMDGMDPLKRNAAAVPDSQWDAEHWRSLDMGAGQTVRLPTSADPTPIVSNVTIDYDFRDTYPQYRNDPNHKFVHWPNIRRYCQAQYGDGWEPSPPGQQMSCTASSASHQVDAQAVCNFDAAAGGFGSSIAVWNELEQAWMCGFHSDAGARLVPYCQSLGIAHPHVKLSFGQIVPPGGATAQCDDGQSTLDPTKVCHDVFGRGFSARGFDSGPSQQNPEASCSGTFADAREATGVPQATILTYPGRTPYDPRAAAVGSTTNVVVPLQWKGDSEEVCKGESIELVIGLQRGANADPIDTLLSSP